MGGSSVKGKLTYTILLQSVCKTKRYINSGKVCFLYSGCFEIIVKLYVANNFEKNDGQFSYPSL